MRIRYLFVATAMLLLQHLRHLSWDFTAYVVNAQFWFSGGSYFEIYRPPLVPLILSLFSAISWEVAEYALIVISSVAFYIATGRLSDTLGVQKEHLYLFCLTPYFLLNATVDGTELLGLAFLTLFLDSLLRGAKGGHYLGLGILTRYSLIPYLAFMLLQKPKNWIREGLLVLGPLAPWLGYNYIYYGNALMSILDNRFMNFTSRAYYHQNPQIMDILLALNILIPLVIYGIYKMKARKADILMISVMLITIGMYALTPQKQARYLFNLVLPAAYFATIAVNKIDVYRFYKTAIVALMVLTGIWLIADPFQMVLQTKHSFDTAQIEEDLGIENCSLMTNSWVYQNYNGRPALPYPTESRLEEFLDKGHIVLLQYRLGDPSYMKNEGWIENFPIMAKTDQYVVLGEGCVKPIRHTIPYRDFVYSPRPETS